MNYITVEGFDGWLNIILYILFHPFLMMVWGIVIHFIKAELDRARQEGRPPIGRLVLDSKLKIMFGIFSALAAYGIMMPSANKMGVISDDVMLTMRGLGFAIGYMCDSIADTLASKVSNRLNKDQT